MQDIRAVDVFTPTKPAQLTFIERKLVNTQLVDALQTPGKQIVVYGPSGSGKTTLLWNKLYQIYPRHITSRCNAATTFESLIVSAFDELNPFYTVEVTHKKAKSGTLSLGMDYMNIKSSLQLSGTEDTSFKVARMLPPQLTPQRLAVFCGAADCCWVLEDFHKVPESEKIKMAQTMKIFMDTANEYPDVKVIWIGAVDSARSVIQYDPDMRNRVAEVAVPLMSEGELIEIIRKGSDLLKIDFRSVEGDIASYSSGLAAVCHQLCLNVCFAMGISSTCPQKIAVSADQLREAVQRYLRDASDTLKSAFDLALKRHRSRKYDNTRLVLRALASLGDEGGTHAEIMRHIIPEEPTYRASNATTYLKELQKPERGSIIRHDPVSGKFFFSDPVYLSFAQCLFDVRKKTGKAWAHILGVNIAEDVVVNALVDTYRQILRDEKVRMVFKTDISGKP